ALAVTCSEKRVRGSSERQASCLEIEGPRTSPKTGAPNERQGHQSVTPTTDRGHGDPAAWPQDSAPLYRPRQKVCQFLGPVCRQAHRRGCPPLSGVVGVNRTAGADCPG